MGVDYQILGKNIKYYRKQKKLTQEQMAELLDLSTGFVSQIERGIARLSPGYFSFYLRSFGVFRRRRNWAFPYRTVRYRIQRVPDII